MSTKTINLTPKLYDYLLHVSLREHPVLQELRAMTAQLSAARMQISPEQGQFMALLIQLLDAKKTVDVGTFTGYSALTVALAMSHEGRVIACDVSREWTNKALTYWEKAGVANKIQLNIAPALDTLQKLIENGESATFDFIFIDADKKNYLNYYERALTLLRPGGLIAIDNVLWDGRVADEDNQEPETLAIRAMNKSVKEDARVTISLVPIGDGLMLVRKS